SAWKKLISGAAQLLNPSMRNVAISISQSGSGGVQFVDPSVGMMVASIGQSGLVDGTPMERTQALWASTQGIRELPEDFKNWTADIIQSGWEWSKGQFSNNPYMNWAVDILPFNHVYNFGVNVGLKY